MKYILNGSDFITRLVCNNNISLKELAKDLNISKEELRNIIRGKKEITLPMLEINRIYAKYDCRHKIYFK